MSDMIPFAGDAAATARGLLAMVRFARDLHAAPVPETMEPLPPLNARGGRSLPTRGWRSVYSVVITEDMCNPLGGLHGGAAATLIDTVNSASLAVLTTESFWGPPMLTGLTLTLDLAYYNACPAGTKARLTVTIEHLSGTLCNLRGELTDWETGKRFVTGSQVKTWRDLRGKL